MDSTTERSATQPAMNQDIFSGQWRQMRGALRSWWGKLTEDDFERIGGQKDKLIGMLQEKYGYAKDVAQREVDRRFQEYSSQGGSGTSAGVGRTTQSGERDASYGAGTYDQTRAKAQEWGSAASEKLSGAGTAVGEKMASVAGSIRHNAPQEGTLGSAAQTVANQLETAGSYLQQNDFEHMAKDLTALIRRYPVQSLLIGLGIGYLFSRRSER